MDFNFEGELNSILIYTYHYEKITVKEFKKMIFYNIFYT